MFLYNPPTAAPLGVAAALSLLVLAAICLWRSGQAGSLRLPLTLSSVASGIMGTSLLVCSVALGMVELNFERAATNFVVELPHTTALDIVLCALVTTGLAIAVIAAVLRRSVLGTFGFLVLFGATFTTMADVIHMHLLDNNWALVESFGWMLTVLAGVAFVAILAAVKIRAYGAKQFQLGQLQTMDTAEKSAVI